MTDKTPAMPELPEPDYWSTRDDDTPLFTAAHQATKEPR